MSPGLQCRCTKGQAGSPHDVGTHEHAPLRQMPLLPPRLAPLLLPLLPLLLPLLLLLLAVPSAFLNVPVWSGRAPQMCGQG